ncbi:photosystem I reaction center subunit PsaK [Calothrix rhizosoleniae]|uniref:photosystem I reaction center subunit PsaK n=1 Tax=Calothrix rhizosoleniae TaxID=888997 RepID=UPI000B4A06A5|nr:photosystem I reaction center subunit PsaK [Calothrix rhizosoleniae]
MTQLFSSSTLAIIPTTVPWYPKVAMVMIIANIFAIFLGKLVIKNPVAQPPLPMPIMFGGMGWSELLATMSLGHILGLGAILGLANMGYL